MDLVGFADARAPGAKMSRMRPYVGLHRTRKVREVFHSDTPPTEEVHGRTYVAVIGPFRTVRGARFMAQFGANNPHCVTVADAERCAIEYPNRCTWQTSYGMGSAPAQTVCGAPCKKTWCDEHRQDACDLYPQTPLPD